MSLRQWFLPRYLRQRNWSTRRQRLQRRPLADHWKSDQVLIQPLLRWEIPTYDHSSTRAWLSWLWKNFVSGVSWCLSKRLIRISSAAWYVPRFITIIDSLVVLLVLVSAIRHTLFTWCIVVARWNRSDRRWDGRFYWPLRIKFSVSIVKRVFTRFLGDLTTELFVLTINERVIVFQVLYEVLWGF